MLTDSYARHRCKNALLTPFVCLKETCVSILPTALKQTEAMPFSRHAENSHINCLKGRKGDFVFF